MKLTDLSDKKVLIWGAGREAEAFLRAGEHAGFEMQVTVVQDNPESGQMCRDYVVEKISERHIADADVIVRSPGISKYRPELEFARENGVELTTATNLWFAEPHSPVIVVTGTKGKSTTSSLIYHILNSLSVSAELAGNIGRSPLDFYGEPEPQWWVLELSSFQISDLQYSPSIAVLTSFSPEHLDWHQTEDAYLADKLNAFTNCDNDSKVISIVNGNNEGALGVLDRIPNPVLVGNDGEGIYSDGQAFYFDGHFLFKRSNLQLQGKHNEQLLSLALTVVAETGVDLIDNAERIAKALLDFQPLPHRLNPVGEYRGILYIDDSLATTPIASIAAVEAFSDRPLTLLIGGYDRGLGYEELAQCVVKNKERVRVVALPDSGYRIAELMKAELGDAADIIFLSDNLAHAVCIASEITPEGGVVLLSPGAPSFGYFKNYADRGNAFALAVKQTVAS